MLHANVEPNPGRANEDGPRSTVRDLLRNLSTWWLLENRSRHVPQSGGCFQQDSWVQAGRSRCNYDYCWFQSWLSAQVTNYHFLYTHLKKNALSHSFFPDHFLPSHCCFFMNIFRCLSQDAFICRSATYDARSFLCLLSKETVETMPKFFQPDPEFEYLENACLNGMLFHQIFSR